MKYPRVALVAAILSLTLGVLAPAYGQVPNLRSARSFAALGYTTVTNTGASAVIGDVGVSPGTAVTGFPPATLTSGAIYAGGPVAVKAQSDAALAYSDVAGRAYIPSHDLSGQDLGGLTLTPGVYHLNTSAHITSTLTLDARGDRNAIFLFQIGTTLTTASNVAVKVVGGGNKENVFWQVGSSATLGTGTRFQGNILAYTSITMTTGASLFGRAIAQNGAVTLDTNAVSAGNWRAADIAVGSDGLTRILWTDVIGRMVIWSLDSSGVSTPTSIFGPYEGVTPQAIACGADHLTRVLWTNVDGAMYLWHLNPDNSLRSSFAYPPHTGWVAVDLSVGSDSKAHILTNDGNGSMIVWTADTSGNITQSPMFGPFNGWTATRIASGTDTLTRILWCNVDGSVEVWHLKPDNTHLTTVSHGPYPGWSAVDISVGSDNKARVLWVDINGRMVIWNWAPDNSFAPTQATGPINAWLPLSIASGTDGLTRILWNQNDNMLGLWFLNQANILQSSFARRGSY